METNSGGKMNIYDLSIDQIGLSTRSSNCLRRNGIHTVGEMMECQEESLKQMRNLGVKSIQEILEKKEEYRTLLQKGEACDDVQTDSPKDLPKDPPKDQEPAAPEPLKDLLEYELWLKSDTGKEFISDYLRDRNEGLDSLIFLSAKTFNLLTVNGFFRMHEVIHLTNEDLMKIPRMDAASAEEIENACHQYLLDHQETIRKAYLDRLDSGSDQQRKPTIFDMTGIEQYHDTILNYVRFNDVDLDYSGLSTRALRALRGMECRKMSDIIFLSRPELEALYSVGRKTVNEILQCIRTYLLNNQKNLEAVCSGDESALTDEDTMKERILSLYSSLGFRGLSLQEMVDRLELPEQITQEHLKRCIGRLLAEQKLEYVDFRCYRVYQRFSDQLALCDSISERSREMIRRRLEGETLGMIAGKFDLTRERVRQIIKKDVLKVSRWHRGQSGTAYFDEDYYKYFFAAYSFSKQDAFQWFGITPSIWQYMEMMEIKRGEKDLQFALDDAENLDAGLRLKIKNYLNQNKLFIDGMWVEKKRAGLERIAVQKYCKDTVSFDDFTVIYNRFLEQEDIDYDESIYYTPSVIRSRKNHLAEAHYLLWKQKEQMRYYDIEGHDFSELLDVLNLNEYENTEMSTEKLLEDYPEIMSKYDIRDQYELHNLLRKVVPEGAFHDFHCGKMPMIRFGTFDREAAIRDMIAGHSPISASDLCRLLHEEYGYDPDVVMGSYLHSFSPYLIHGKYVIGQKTMEDAQRTVLMEELKDSFYFMDEIRDIYLERFPDSDPAFINPYNLKAMGFSIYSRYVLQHYDSLDQYFEEILTKEDVTDITAYRHRFAYVQAFSQKLTALKRDLQIIEFEPNQMIHIRKLEESGITRSMLKEYCDQVFQFVEEGAYFSAASLRKGQFSSELDDLGFSDCFYSSLLISDPRFSFGTMFGTVILYKGQKNITIQSFETDLIQKHGSVDTYDLMHEMTEVYGCRISDRHDIIYKVQGTEVFYDKILDRLYANASIYEQEIESVEVI